MRYRDVQVLNLLRQRSFLALLLLEFLAELKLFSVQLADANFELNDARLKSIIVLVTIIDCALQVVDLLVLLLILLGDLTCHLTIVACFFFFIP